MHVSGERGKMYVDHKEFTLLENFIEKKMQL